MMHAITRAGFTLALLLTAAAATAQTGDDQSTTTSGGQATDAPAGSTQTTEPETGQPTTGATGSDAPGGQSTSGSVDESGADQSATPDTNDTTTPSNPSTAVVESGDYVEQAAAGDLFEIESSKLALATSQNDGIRRFAQMMIDDHTRMSEALKQAVVGNGLDFPIPTAPEGDEQQRLSALSDAGDDFDRQYVGMQLQAHENALRLHRAYAEGGDDAALREVATSAVPMIEHHLEQIRAIAEPFMSSQQ